MTRPDVTAEILNLRRARKAKARRDAEQKAAENRVLFGRTKAERQITRSERERNARQLDGSLRDGVTEITPPGRDEV
ncbi:MAG: DUF4169 family protein [Hyphomicrobiaceae bacterium]